MSQRQSRSRVRATVHTTEDPQGGGGNLERRALNAKKRKHEFHRARKTAFSIGKAHRAPLGFSTQAPKRQLHLDAGEWEARSSPRSRPQTGAAGSLRGTGRWKTRLLAPGCSWETPRRRNVPPTSGATHGRVCVREEAELRSAVGASPTPQHGNENRRKV